uniref:sensor histidine kinase n=1 Tax=Gordonia sp. B7-2 TaxID=3420932 RepID=UPI003D8DDAF2
MGKLLPRSLAGQAVALQVAVVAVIVIGGSVLAVIDSRIDEERAARDQVTAVAVALADAPSVAAALEAPDPTAALQPVTEQVRAATGIAFITIMSTDGTRFTHTTPALIGQKYIGATAQALRGEVYTEEETGTLGPSIRTIAPVRAPDGRIVGMVAAGITIEKLTEAWMGQLPLILTVAVASLVVASGGLWLIRRRLRAQTGGLAPAELRLMYEHHDAVLHAIREGLIVLDDGRAVLANDEARRLLGSVADAGENQLDMPGFLIDGVGSLDDVLTAHRGRVLMMSRSPVPGREDGAVVTIRDRSEVLEALGELDTMTRFAETLRSRAHESANRLHTIITLIEMGRADEAARSATTELELSQQLIDHMTDAVAEPTLAALLLGKIAQASERGITLTLTEDSHLTDRTAGLLQPSEMITVVGNLIDNALDAADPDDPWVEVTIVGDAASLEVTVADSGPGMDPDVFTKAQERGYSTKNGGDEAGRGLGLALVAQVVARHHGTLRAENTYGSVVTTRLGRAVNTGSTGAP